MMIFTGTSPTLAAAAVWQTTEDKFPFPPGMLKVTHMHSNYIYTIFKTFSLTETCKNTCVIDHTHVLTKLIVTVLLLTFDCCTFCQQRRQPSQSQNQDICL